MNEKSRKRKDNETRKGKQEKKRKRIEKKGKNEKTRKRKRERMRNQEKKRKRREKRRGMNRNRLGVLSQYTLSRNMPRSTGCICRSKVLKSYNTVYFKNRDKYQS